MSVADNNDPAAHPAEDAADQSAARGSIRGAVRGRVDSDGRLIQADAKLLAIHRKAGGALGEVLAIGPLAGIARLAFRLCTMIERPVIVADGDKDVELWVRARLEDDVVELLISEWRELPPVEPIADPDREHDFLRAEADWTWESDAALRLTALSEPGTRLLAHEGQTAPLGLPLARLFRLVESGEDELPLLNALADQARFEDQRVMLRTSGARYRLAALPVIDGRGAFAGFRGIGVALGEHGDGDAPAHMSAFAHQLDRALRQPLDRIIAGAESIRAQDEGPVTAEYVVYAADIAHAGRHLLGLVDDLVDLDAIERPDFSPPAEPIDLADLGRRAAGLLDSRATEKRIRIELPTGASPLIALGDVRRTLQILVNLIGNAVRFSPEESVVRIELAQSAGHAEIAVADQGPGVPRKDQDKIFEKFERLGTREPGSGLGLYIARRLARAMAGDVTVDSRRGEGARFTLTLPAGE